MKLLEVWDFVLSPIYIFILYLLAKRYAISKQKLEPHYKYFANGMLAKMLGGVMLCFIYVYYYRGGDTTQYFQSSVCLNKLFFRHSDSFWRIIFGGEILFEYGNFDSITGYPEFVRDIQSWQVVRFTTLFTFIGLRCYVLTTILLAATAYYGIWQLYKVFIYYFPERSKNISIAILFMPSVLFWGSGILKDTYTLSAAGIVTYSFHQFFILKKNRTSAFIIGFFAASLILKIKPYIFLGLVPGAILWISFERIKKITSSTLKLLIGPVILLLSIGLFSFGFRQISSGLGQYSSVDNILNKASATQKDLKQEYNKGNSFDIGEFDASIGGVLKKFPVAVFAGLYRPTVLDVKNVVMLIAAVENSYMLYLLLSTLYKAGTRQFYKIISGEPIIFFSLIFSLFFAFSVGLTTANFGALVRYKIPAVPFYMAAMFIIQYKEKKLVNPYKQSVRKGTYMSDRENKFKSKV